MDILLIRHAPAVEREDWTDDDLLRPLTPAGRKEAKQFFLKLRALVPTPDRLLTSPALRAVETAALFRVVFRGRKPRIVEDLAPGATPESIASLARTGTRNQVIALVGHEPDLSRAAAALIGGSQARLKLAKGACAWLRRVGDGYELRLLVTPRQLR